MRRIIPFALAVGTLLGGFTASLDARVLYVTEYGGGDEDGSSWDNAFYHIQDALDAADHGDEVWVAEGTYYENLNVSKALALYGGFGGDESDREDRDLDSYVTTIDADQQGNALTSMNPAISVLDGFRIVNGTGFTGDGDYGNGGGALILDFRGTIANVSFEGNSALFDGGGLYLESSNNSDSETTHITLDNVSFDGNDAERGGGLYLASTDNGSPVEISLGGMVFSGNAADRDGGGLYLNTIQNYFGPSGPGGESVAAVTTISNTSFYDNVAASGGGAYALAQSASFSPNWEPDVTISGVTFTNNVASVGGGLLADARVDATNVSFTGNGATDSTGNAAGGGLHVGFYDFMGYGIHFAGNHVSATAGKSAVGGAVASAEGGIYLAASTLTGNSAETGGAVHLGRDARANLTQCTLKDNTAWANGGAVFVSGGRARMESNLIAGNSAGGYGGGLAFDHAPVFKIAGYPLLVLNNTIVGNHAPGGGAGMDIRNYSTVNVVNNIVAFNDSGIRADALSSVTFHNNDVHGNLPGADFQGVPSPVGTLGNIADDPQFVDRAAGDYHLAETSPAKDAGDTGPFFWFSRDVEGNTRVRGSAVDIGAYERAGQPARFVAFGTQPGDAAAPGPLPVQPVVRVLNPNGSLQADYNGPVTISLKPGSGTNGALLGGTTTVTAVNGVATFTNLSLDRVGVAFILTAAVAGSGSVDSNTFTITLPTVRALPAGDDANDGATWATAKRTAQAALDAAAPGGAVWLGAGIYNTGVVVNGASLLGGFSGTETDAAQRNPSLNVVTLDALGWTDAVNVQSNGGAPIVFDGLTIRNANGSGILNFVDNATISNNIFTANTGDSGAGILSFGDNVRVTRNRFDGNAAASRGGAISISYSAVTIDNNLFTGNSAPSGSAIDAYGSSPVNIVNNTVVGGTGGNGALYLDAAGTVVANNIIAANASGINRAYTSSPEPTLNNNLVSGNAAFNYRLLSAGPGDISADPLFVNAAGGDYRLAQGSPAVDAGNDAFLSLSARDLAGSPRKQGARLDIGAYERLVGGVDMGSAIRALRIAGGLTAATSDDMADLNVDDTSTSQNRVDLRDAVRLMRQAAE